MSNIQGPGTPSTGITWIDYLGALLLIDIAGSEMIVTQYGETSAIRADVYVLDGPHAGTAEVDTLIFPKVLQSQLKSRLHEKVAGRLSQGEARKGQNPPWKLLDPTEADLAVAANYEAQHLTAVRAAVAAPDEAPF